MNESIEERAVMLAQYLVEQRTTVRGVAKRFGVSKSTVHKDLSERLERIQPQLYAQVRQILDRNKEERHIRGGMATREKHLREHQPPSD